MADFNPTKLRTRHAQVAIGISQGLTNRQIGETLKLSRHTVAGFVRELLWLLDAKSRSEVAAWVAVNGEYLRRIISTEAQAAAARKAAAAEKEAQNGTAR
jgi:DNA-binding NarL/FixJ family response regulator